MADGWKLEQRDLTDSDITESRWLSGVSFGFPRDPGPVPDKLSPGVTRHGVFHAGRLVGQAFDLHDRQWWGGRVLDAADVGGVSVLPEARGQGLGRTLITTLLARAHERGAVVSTLFPSVAAVYQRFGWSRAGSSIITVDLATALLRGRPTPPGHTLRPGTVADLPAVHDLYVRVAKAHNGMLSREEVRTGYTPGEFPSNIDGLTLVEHDGDLVGYCTWFRGDGRPVSTLTVRDALAVTPDAARAIVTMLGSWDTVTPTIRLRLLGSGAIEACLPLESGQVHLNLEWMHRPVDVAGAVAARGWPTPVRGRAVFSMEDELAPWNTGTWELEIGDGNAELRRTSADTAVHLTVNGFARLYCGVATTAILRQGGLISGPQDEAAALDMLSTSPPPRLLDTF